MNKRNACRIAALVAVAAAAAWVLVAVPTAIPTPAIPTAAAEACPDVEVVFARGTGEDPGVGGTGQAFVDSLHAQTGGKSVNVSAVDYPASTDFMNSIAAGANDASGRVQSMATNCPNTKIVLGGYSQGAAVVDSITETMPTEVADHVAAVAVLGNPKSAYARSVAGGPLPAISQLYGAKTIDLCVQDDPFCSEGANWIAHDFYWFTGLTAKAATFVAGRV